VKIHIRARKEEGWAQRPPDVCTTCVPPSSGAQEIVRTALHEFGPAPGLSRAATGGKLATPRDSSLSATDKACLRQLDPFYVGWLETEFEMNLLEMHVAQTTEGVQRYSADHDHPEEAWNEEERYGKPYVFQSVVALQSTYEKTETYPGNVEVVASEGRRLAHMSQNSRYEWQPPVFFGEDVGGQPGFMQSNIGAKGDFEVIVPLLQGGLAHYRRLNNEIKPKWERELVFGQPHRYQSASVLQNPKTGMFEIVARSGNELHYYAYDFTRSVNPHAIPRTVIFTQAAGEPGWMYSRRRGRLEALVASTAGGVSYVFDTHGDYGDWAETRLWETEAFRPAAVRMLESERYARLEAVGIWQGAAYYFAQAYDTGSWERPFKAVKL